MSDYRPSRSNRDYYDYEPRRSASHSQSRSAARPQGSRPPQNGNRRPPQGGNRRPPQRRRKKRATGRLFVLIAILVVIIAALVFFLGGKGGDKPAAPQATPTPTPETGVLTNATIGSNEPAANPAAQAPAQVYTDADGTQFSSLSAYLGAEDAVLQPLAAEDRVVVTDLSINEELPDTWMNILLLGTDERSLNIASRTDAMMICSINKQTFEVKLTSIMRDLAVTYDDLEEHNGTYRINAANYFGGPEYAMKIVNECFGMNIQHYATVNFFGFQKIAQALGGIEMDITQAEMEQINKNARQQYRIAKKAGIEEPDQINEDLLVYGENTHLNGRQTLAYARIRKIDSDFSRAERQRKVLSALMTKMKDCSPTEVLALAMSLSDQITTNIDLDTILNIAVSVLGTEFKGMDTFRLPINNSYVQETRNEESMFYDCDWNTNARELYSFIYG